MNSNHAGPLRNFGAYAKAVELFDLVVRDVEPLTARWHLSRLLGQQLASADSIAANIEEGYGRESARGYSRFLASARGSARETAGHYLRLRHRLPEQTVEARTRQCGEIIAVLTATIRTLRADS